jgi:hypothetical protein
MVPGAVYPASVIVTIPAGRPVGPVHVWFIADANKTAGQSDFNNDRASTVFAISPVVSQQADLLVQSITVNPASGPAGSTAVLTVTVRNAGTSSAAASTTQVRITAGNAGATTSDPLLYQMEIPPVAAGATQMNMMNVVIPAGRAAGPSTLWVIEDVNNTAGQGSNVGNDRGSVGFTVLP